MFTTPLFTIAGAYTHAVDTATRADQQARQTARGTAPKAPITRNLQGRTPLFNLFARRQAA